MPDVTVGQFIYPTWDAGTSGLTPGIQIGNKVNGGVLVNRTTTGIVEFPTGGGSYDYRTGYMIPNGIAVLKVSWNSSSGGIVKSEDYIVTNFSGDNTTVVVNAIAKFPVGTSVAVYHPNQASPSGGSPSGSTVTSAIVASNGSLTFTNLDDGADYIAAAQVNGVWQYLAFTG